MLNHFTCVIVDDEQDSIDLLANRLNDLYKNITITATYTGWADALQGLRETSSDLLFLDISMPGKTGMDMLRLLPQTEAEIIFVTAYEQYAVEAFSFYTSGYILKPVKDSALANAVNKAIERLENKRLARQPKSAHPAISNKIGIPNVQGVDYVTVSEILYMESVNKCTRIVTAKAEYLSSFQIGKFKEHINDNSFFQVHRSYIINLNFILSYKSSGIVIMSNKVEIPVSRNVRNDFLKIFNSSY